MYTNIGKVVKGMATYCIYLMNQGILRLKYGRRGAMPDYLRVQDIVEQMGVSEETVRIWIRQKKLPAIRIGRDYFIDPNDFQEFLKKHRTDRQDDRS
jgi:excisionase family DNA binding protein